MDGLPLHRFQKVQCRRGIDIPRKTLARWVKQCGEHLQSLLNLEYSKAQLLLILGTYTQSWS
ncbi:hypothetical protein BSZ28_11095 [Pseudomonas moraviensis]|nr:hypothetical protein BSZ28_11095 [Pseudomonas moraviensis]